jgi:hypothetical protein
MKWIVAHHLEDSAELAQLSNEDNEILKFNSECEAVYYLYKIGQNLEEVMIIPEMEFL